MDIVNKTGITGLAIYSVVSNNIISFLVGVVAGLLLNAGVKYFYRVWYYNVKRSEQ